MAISPDVQALMAKMSLAEKVGQMTQVEKNSITPDDVRTYHIGSILSGGGGRPEKNTPAGWLEMVQSFQKAALESRLGIPLLYGVDAVHGHNNVEGAVIFPHNIGLGATRNSELVEKIGKATAIEVAATGIKWDFAPTVAVPQDYRWGRTYEGYSGDAELVAELGVAYLKGLQNEKGVVNLASPRSVLGSVKHFVADGATEWKSTKVYEWMIPEWEGADRDWSIDQGVSIVDEETLRNVHLLPYAAAIAAGAQNIMVSYSSWHETKMHGHHYLLTEVLKGEMGFEGFLVSDWMAIDQISPDFYHCVVTSINAGLDMIMVPFKYKRFIETLIKAVEAGDVSMERIDDAVARILQAKFDLGLFEQPVADDSLLEVVGNAEHRNIARQAVEESVVLLKNEADLLPLAKDIGRLYVAGAAADDIGLQCGGWTIEWMGAAGPITQGTTLWAGIKEIVGENGGVHYAADGDFSAQGGRAEVGLVVLHEMPYAEGTGDRADLNLPEADVALLEKMRAQCDQLVVLLYSGRPLIISEQMPMIDALVAAWLPGSEADGVANVLFGRSSFTGKLSYAWPRHMGQVPARAMAADDEPPLFPLGYGLVTSVGEAV
ncbi:MAG TPA: glycoside hydrolase family 3 N-terminal domain-containing protein [Anaerolineae bacterium]|nr:glycoside hydrolase family 3 N-terminal domain-containing protein [Anaerolineae bacterium]